MTSMRFVPQAPWDGLLTMTPGAVLYRGPGGDADYHAHHAVQLMISPDEPFVLELEGKEKRTSAALIPSGVEHRLRCGPQRLLLMLVEPFGPRGRGLNTIAGRMTGLELERALMPVLAKSADTSDAVVVIDSLIRAVDPAVVERVAQLSVPVRSALRYLERTASSKPSLGQAAAEAHISPSRLTHLFTGEVGIPFRRYGLWIRLRRAAEHVAGGSNLTQAAVAAGFSDSAHLSRAFKTNFGLNPSVMFEMKLRDAWPEDTSTRH
ncbi:AraC-like DNA-binding protein [Rhodococcus sp. OK302]|nr:AraC-like DNA-binding protein [Rhodococcus sp. OK302]